jgi:hypothetical protein
MDFEKFWENVNAYTSPMIRKNFSEHAVTLLQGLLMETFKYDNVDISLFLDPKNPIALLTYDQWNSDKQLSLRLHRDGKFDLYFECYEEDDYQSVIYELPEQDKTMIPDGLRQLMTEVIKTQHPVSVHKNTLEIM